MFVGHTLGKYTKEIQSLSSHFNILLVIIINALENMI